MVTVNLYIYNILCPVLILITYSLSTRINQNGNYRYIVSHEVSTKVNKSVKRFSFQVLRH